MTAATPTTKPADFRTVSWDEFYAYIGPRDIVLRAERESVLWETRGRHLVGYSTPGWANPEAPKSWALTRDAF